jgi:2-hydroxy-4-carboxymuconate semialdehyde hemiacetal dehydrogenase
MTIKVALAGAGAFGTKHLDAIKAIDGVEVVSLVGRELPKTQEVAARTASPMSPPIWPTAWPFGSRCRHPVHAHADARRPDAIACLKAGKHVQVEIPLADSLADAQAVVDLAQGSGKVAMCGHTRRFNPSHQWVHQRIVAGEFNIQQMDVQTYFFRRTNMNALGQPRSWTDHLLWHHAAHTVDLFAYQAAARSWAHAMQGPDPPDAGHRDGHEHPAEGGQRCDLHAEPVVQQRRPAGHLLPLHRRHRHLHRALRRPVQRQGREDRRQPGRCVDERHRAAGPRVLRAIREGREPNASVAQVLPCYQVLHGLEQQLS